MLGLASTLLYAIASQRGLLIEWPEIDGFSGDSYEALFEPAHDMPILLPQMLREWSLDYKSFTKMAVTLEVNNGHPAPYEALFCRNLSVAYSDAVFIVLSTNQFFAPAILYNKHHTQQVQGLLASPPPRAWLGGAWASTDGRQQVRGVGGEVSKKAAQELESAEEEVLASPYRFAPVFSPPPGHASPPPNNNANPPCAVQVNSVLTPVGPVFADRRPSLLYRYVHVGVVMYPVTSTTTSAAVVAATVIVPSDAIGAITVIPATPLS